MNKKTIIIILTVLLGLGTGSLANSFLASGGLDGLVKEVKYSLPVQVTVSEDPDVNSFSADPSNFTQNASYEDLKIRNVPIGKGPWGGTRWSYMPPQSTETDLEGSVLMRNEPGKSNIYQFVRLPNQEMNLVMKARNPAEALGLDTSSCSTSKGFVNIEKWNGPIPVKGIPQAANTVRESSKRVNKTFGSSTEKLVMDIPDRFEGEKVIFYGGLSADQICDGPAATLLEIDELYITTE